MSRPTRLRRLSSKLSSNDYIINVPKALTKSSVAQNSTAKLRSKKGINNKLSNNDALLSLRSPVLRDRTNLTKEPTTKLNVLKKGPEDKDAADTKIMIETRTKRTRVIKPTAKQDSENHEFAERKIKKDTEAVNNKGKVLKIKKSDATTSHDSPYVLITEIEQKLATTKTVTKKLTKNASSKTKSMAPKIERTRKSVPKQQLESTRVTRTLKNSVSNNKLEPSTKITSNKSKESKKLSITRKTIANQSTKNTARLSTNEGGAKLANKINGKKFFQSKLKTPISVKVHSKISPLKRPMTNKTRKLAANQKNLRSRSSVSFCLRQTTLSESFSKQPKKVLRPRKSSKNYCDETKLDASEQDNKNKLDNIIEKKGPVYTTVQETDENNIDKEKVYDFVFDLNDSKEHATKKRKKRVIRKPSAKRAKIVAKESQVKPISTIAIPTITINKISDITPEPPIQILDDEDIINNDNKLTTVTAEIHLPPAEISHKDGNALTDEVTKSIVEPAGHSVPQIISVEELKGEHCINLMATPLQSRSISDKSLLLNKPNKFNLRPSAQFKTMMNASLIRRSLSPIKNDNPKDNFESSSPWRVPTINTFSRVKNVFQSTPQGKKFTTLLDKASLTNKKVQMRRDFKMNNIAEQNDENANISLAPKSSENIQSLSGSKSPRKFGTVISNINDNSPVKQHSIQINTSKSPRKFGTVISNINESLPKTSPIITQRIKLPTSVKPSVVYDSINTSLPNYDEISSMSDNEFIHDKENSAPNTASPTKSPTKRNNLSGDSSVRPINNQKLTGHITEDIIESLPGPSGLQKPILLTNTLKQSNLNKFLNLPDMPGDTKMNTVHDLFHDAHSTPIAGKTMKKMTKVSLGVMNAFGFDDDDTDDIDVSPINRYPPVVNQHNIIDNKLKSERISTLKKTDDKIAVTAVQQPARFSVGKIKQALLPTKSISKDNKKEKLAIINENDSPATNRDAIQAVHFSDTFDTMDNEIDEENVKEVPLFVDVEPVHFIQPPRYSYGHKRKRNMLLNSSEETDDDERTDEHYKRTKKKKIGKAEREQKKLLNEWAKSMNNTFEEIDHFDLVVE